MVSTSLDVLVIQLSQVRVLRCPTLSSLAVLKHELYRKRSSILKPPGPLTQDCDNYPPWKGDIVFGLSVCPSVRLSVCPGRFFSHFVGVTPPTVFITHKSNLYHLKAGCLECVMGGSVFSYPPKFRRNRSLKTVQNHKFIFSGASEVKEF